MYTAELSNFSLWWLFPLVMIVLVRFDALSIYQKYTDLFDIDDVPEEERKKTAQKVADTVLTYLNKEAAG